MNLHLMIRFCYVMSVFLIGACTQPPAPVATIKQFPLDSLEGVLTQSGVQLDKEVSSDGKGAIKIVVSEPTVVRLFELGDIDLENARLIYQAKVRTKDVQGQVYLEMWCSFPGKGEFFSRGLETSLSGTTEWSTQQTPFFLKSGENPDNVKLNIVFTGKGTAWIDDIQIQQGPLG